VEPGFLQWRRETKGLEQQAILFNRLPFQAAGPR